jgi:ribosomal protein S18 acetylase RimI-like enzyme
MGKKVRKMLNIRRFVKGADETAWVGVLNSAYQEYEVWWRAITVEEMREQEKRPNFDSEGRFVAELDGKPVGIIHAHVDKLRKERKGFVHIFCVIPEFRGLGVEERLLDLAVNELKGRGMNLMQAWTDHSRNDRIQILEKAGFKLVDVESDMEINLTHIPTNIGENKQVTIRSLRKNEEEDIRILNWLSNESFKEHFDYRPRTIDETRDSLVNDPYLPTYQECFFAMLNEKNVGFVRVGIDEKYNIEKNVKCGRIRSLGVLKPYRRRGVGAKLTLQGLETLRAKGMTKAILDVDDFNPTKAIKLYEKVGFKVAKKYLKYEKGL